MRMIEVRCGIYGGLAGGLIVGILMVVTRMPLIGRMFGVDTVGGGLLMHLTLSALIGALFGALTGQAVRGPATGIRHGMVYSGLWWLLSPVLLTPLLTGTEFPPAWNLGMAVFLIPGLALHLVFGAILGASYGVFCRGSEKP